MRKPLGGRTLFLASAGENPGADEVILPLHVGRRKDSGESIFFVLFESSDGNDAARRGINRSAKLVHVRDTAAVMRVTLDGDTIVFPASVDFAHAPAVQGNPDTGFPPLSFQAGPLGEDAYSPLIQLPNGTILNAPHVMNNSGRHPKVLDTGTASGRLTVTLQETLGFAGGKRVRYVSTDASDPLASALERSTLAPRLAIAPFAGGDGSDSARASLAAFLNGQTGVANPERQGINSALLGEGDPLNVLAWTPNQGRYSPLWDVHPAVWDASEVAANRNTRQTDFGDVLNLAREGRVAGPDGLRFGPFPTPGGVIVNCPIISAENIGSR